LNAASKVKEKVFDQDEPIDAIHRAIKLARAGMQEKDSTYGNYLLAGPTGVGKSEVAKQFADVLGMKLVRIDMSEYMEKHTVSKLIGAPPGYVGHDAAGQLTGPIMEANKEGKDVLLLLDEVEKAHPAVFNVLLQVLDDARLTDSKGNVADFRKTLVLGTTNAGAREAAAQKEASKKPKMGFGVGLAETYNEEAAESITMKAIKEFFSPEFRNRLDGIFQFNELSDTAIRKIANKFIDEMNHLPAAEANNLIFGVTEDALEKLAVQGHDPEMGARPMKRLIKAEFREKVADLILEEGIRDLHLDIDYDADEEKFTIKRSPIDDNVQLLLAGPSNDGKPESTPPEGSIIDRHFG
jgi:ATP-dependent Clp protease ATP-binding subunit ClpA